MEEVIMEVLIMSRAEEMNVLDWDTIVRTFAQPHFSQLRRVLIRISARWPYPYPYAFISNTRSWLQGRLRASQARDIFRIDIT
jgi:hypothetical protein